MSALPGRPLPRILLSTVAGVSGVVLLLGLKPHTTGGATSALAQTGTSPAPAPGASSPAAPGATSPASGGGTTPKAGGGSTAKPGSGSTAKRTVDGNTIQTRYGPVQLRVTLTGSKITAVSALQLPTDNPRDQEISGFAIPQLNQEALAAQSAHIDTVSGASYTSDGYTQSLQSALDKAGA